MSKLVTSCICLAALVAAAPAAASRSQVSIIQDDSALYGGIERDGTLDEFRSLGADWVKVLVLWKRFAPDADSRRAPRFDASDPEAYPPGSFAALDEIVRAIVARGMKPMLAPTGPGPRWASPGGRAPEWKPSPRQFGRFVQALGVRYSGAHSPAGAATPLPRVVRWAIWNEPNQPGWLQPQFERRRPFAPHHYRELYRWGEAALTRSSHRRDLILIGETAPLGDRSKRAISKMKPGLFLRELFCVKRRRRGSDRLVRTRARKCRRYKRPRTRGLAHHPYVKFRSLTPRSKPRDHDEFPIGATVRLERLLRETERARRLRGRTPIYFTEYGWQTNPPDRFSGISLDRQAEFINESDLLAYRRGRVKSVSQYLLKDDPHLAGFQTGLRFTDARPKPAYDAYRLPLVLERRGRRKLRIWAHVRPAAGRETAELLFATAEAGPFEPSPDPSTGAATVTTNALGYLTLSRPYARGFWKLRWTSPSGRLHESRVVPTPRR